MRTSKFLSVLLTVVYISGCATVQPLSCDEGCALSGMVCKGQTISISQSLGAAYGSSEIVPIETTSRGLSFQCEMPTTDEQKARLVSLKMWSEEKVKDNKTAASQNEIGWVLGGILAAIGLGFAMASAASSAAPAHYAK